MRRSWLVRLMLLVLPSVWMLGCGAASRLTSSLGNKYRYTLSMVQPAKSDSLLFRDHRLIIQFRFDDPAIRFQVQNISSVPMRIDWPRVLLDLGGLPQPVRTLATFYDTSIVLTLGPALQPLGVMREVIAPRTGVTVRGSQWRLADLLPTTDGNSFSRESAIRGSVGRKISLTLPVQFGRETITYGFVFSVDAVQQISWNEYASASWLPPVPAVVRLGPSSEDNLTAAIIVGGFAGLISYMLTVKKTPVVE